MQQHLYLREESGQGGGGAGNAGWEPPEGVPTLTARLEYLLSVRQDLVRHLAALAPSDGAREALEQRLQALTAEQERLLHALVAIVPPAKPRAA